MSVPGDAGVGARQENIGLDGKMHFRTSERALVLSASCLALANLLAKIEICNWEDRRNCFYFFLFWACFGYDNPK